MQLVMRSVASVCLSCSCHNFWKAWSTNFIYFWCVDTSSEHLLVRFVYQGHPVNVKVRGAKSSCQPSVTELSRLLRLVSGTVYRSTSHLRSHCQSSAVASRHISSGAGTRDYVVVPEKLHCHIWIRVTFFLLLTSVVGHSLLSARWPVTLCLTISATQCLVIIRLEQHWRNTFLQVSEHVAH